MPRVDRKAALALLASWLSDLSGGRLSARQTRSPRGDLELLDSRTGRTRYAKLAVRETSNSSTDGKNFSIRRAVLESDRNGIVILLYLNEGGLKQGRVPVKAAWAVPYRSFSGLAGELSARDTYQCRPVHSPTEFDQWSPYRRFSERDLVERVLALCDG